MRQDLKKVVTERPRSGGYKSPKGYSKHETSLEDSPKREKIRQKWKCTHTAKDFTDVLGPLRGFLRKQVGRPWDKVYSEISKVLPQDSVQNIHIHDHIWGYVEKNVIIINGKPCYKGDRFHGTPIYSDGRHPQFYIHPVNGLLCLAKKGKSKWNYGYEYPKPPEPGIKAYKGVQYHKIMGKWYEVKVSRFPRPRGRDIPLPWTGQIRDEVLGVLHENSQALCRVYGGSFIGESKRLLTKKEIRAASLEPQTKPQIVQ